MEDVLTDVSDSYLHDSNSLQGDTYAFIFNNSFHKAGSLAYVLDQVEITFWKARGLLFNGNRWFIFPNIFENSGSLSGLCIRIIQEAFLKCQDLALTLRDSNLIDLDAQTF